MSALPSPHPISLDEFEKMPDTPGVQELIDGVVVSVPPAKNRHTRIWRAIESSLLKHLPRERVWPESGFIVGRHCLQPDLAVSHSSQGLERDWFSGAPLIAVEVASRGNTPNELDRKTELYLAHGAEEVWVVYDTTKSVMMHTRSAPARYRESMVSPALGLEFDVTEWFK